MVVCAGAGAGAWIEVREEKNLEAGFGGLAWTHSPIGSVETCLVRISAQWSNAPKITDMITASKKDKYEYDC